MPLWHQFWTDKPRHWTNHHPKWQDNNIPILNLNFVNWVSHRIQLKIERKTNPAQLK